MPNATLALGFAIGALLTLAGVAAQIALGWSYWLPAAGLGLMIACAAAFDQEHDNA